MAINSPFFDTFPKMQYDINNTGFGSGSHETVVDIFFRFGIIKNIVNDLSAYYTYDIQESDTPEILAENVYGDAGAGWIIIYANKIIDPLFDWPLNYDAFNKMIIDKYGSIENAQTTIHHYEKVITRTNEFYETTTVSRFVIDPDILTENSLDVPYDYQLLPEEVNIYNIDGKTVTETIKGETVYDYDYEVRLNDSKKLIKIIKAEYYTPIMNEFKLITKTIPSYVRI